VQVTILATCAITLHRPDVYLPVPVWRQGFDLRGDEAGMALAQLLEQQRSPTLVQASQPWQQQLLQTLVPWLAWLIHQQIA
jgi:hypothetical protein